MDAALKLSGIELSEEQVQAFGQHFVEGLEPQLKTPRQANLYGNALTFALPILNGEVNPVDQILIEGVRIFYPKVYEVIRDNREYFLKGRDKNSHDDNFRKRAIEIVDDALEGIGVDKERVKRGLIEVLFPRFKNMVYGSDWDSLWQKINGSARMSILIDIFVMLFPRPMYQMFKLMIFWKWPELAIWKM